jgi:bifunctional non-homologous end joining protein LigD
LQASLRPGAAHLSMSTISPGAARALAAEHEARGPRTLLGARKAWRSQRPTARDERRRVIMGLQAYRAKRDFQRTREPRGGETASTEGHSFVVQEHAARRLHYDLRLELDGVLKSWAVTRGPSLVPGEKRLAVEVEDHPIEYGGFEGTIPEGEYGAGSVIIWDRGVWEPIGDPREGLAKGHLDFRLHGEKLKGRWALIRMAPRRGVNRNLWLLIKARDEEAREASDPDILTEAPRSVVSGREIEDVGEGDAVWNSRSSGRRGEDKAAAKRARKSEAASRAKARPAAVAAKAAPKRLVAADPPTAPTKTVGRAVAVKLTHPDRVYWPDVGLT